MPKTLVTHVRPHLDDICAFWLLRKYAPEAKDAPLDFIYTNTYGGDQKDDLNHICVGVGRGKYDEHKGDVGQCSTTLVYIDLKERGLIPETDLAGLEKLVAWALLEDTGKLTTMEHREFAIPIVLQNFFIARDRDSHAVAELGFMMLDAMLVSAKNVAQIERDWENRIAFTSRFGAAVALISGTRDLEAYAYVRGFDVVAIINPAKTFHNIRAKAGTPIDLTSAYEELKKREPQAGWYFHHSKKLLICGGDLAPGATPSKLTLEGLVDLLK